MQVKTYHLINASKSMIPICLEWKDKSKKGRCFSLFRGKKTKITEDEYNHPRIQKLIKKKHVRVAIKAQTVQITPQG